MKSNPCACFLQLSCVSANRDVVFHSRLNKVNVFTCTQPESNNPSFDHMFSSVIDMAHLESSCLHASCLFHRCMRIVSHRAASL